MSFLLLFAGVIFAQQEPIKNANLNKTFDLLKKASFYIQCAEEKLYEAKAAISKGKPESVNILLKDYEKAINEAMNEINKAQNQGKDVKKAYEEVEKATQKHIEILTDLLNKVPEEAKPAIIHALEVSKHGRIQALNALSKLQKGESPMSKTESVKNIESSRNSIENHSRFKVIRNHREFGTPGRQGRRK